MKSSSNNLDPLLNKNEVTIVIPTLNEEDGIELVVQELRAEGYSDLLVVDGYSIDNTVEIAKKLKVNVITQEGLGKAGAIITAINQIRTNRRTLKKIGV